MISMNVDNCLSDHVTEPLLLVCDCPKARPFVDKVALDQKCDAVGQCYCPPFKGRYTIYKEGIGCVLPGKLHFYCTLDKKLF